MPLLSCLVSLRAEIRAAAAASRARDMRVFGSVARGEERPERDVDLLVALDPARTLFGLAALEERLEERLEDRLGRPVQVATARDLRAPVRRAAERDAVRVA